MRPKFRLTLLLTAASLFMAGCLGLGDLVWEDVNGDGVQDAGEAGLPGVTVNLYAGTVITAGQTPDQSAVTDSNGLYSFSQLPPGDYQLEFVPLSGYQVSPQDASTDAIDSDPDPNTGRVGFTLTELDGDLDFDAGMLSQPVSVLVEQPAETFSIGDFVWLDVNGDGIQDADEPGVEGVSVRLLDASESEVDATSTDGAGTFQFNDVPGGVPGGIPGDESYSVAFTLPAGYEFTLQDAGSDDGLDSDADPATGQTVAFTLGSDRADVDTGLVLAQSAGGCPDSLGPNPEDIPEGCNPLTGLPYCEAEAKDWGVVGISISHFPPAATRPPSGLSWAAWVTEWWIGDGDTRMYALYKGCFPHLDPALTASLVSNLAFDPDSLENDYLVGDWVWYDSNGNSVQDAGEPGIPGLSVDYTTAGGSVLMSTVTDQNGFYFFDVEAEPGDQFRIKFHSPIQPGTWAFVEQNAISDDFKDSDANVVSGLTGVFTFADSPIFIDHVDAGFRLTAPIVGIRSGRPVFGQINSFLAACAITAGVDPNLAGTINICASATVGNSNDIGSGFVDASRLRNIAMQRPGDANLTGNLFSLEPPEGGATADQLEMFYNVANITRWNYDSGLGSFIRSQNLPTAQETFDVSNEALTGEALGFENVIVMFVPHTQGNADGTVFTVGLDFATGPAKIFRDGMVYEVQWSTVSGDYEQETGMLRPIRFEFLDGTPFPLKPGKLWIHMVHTASGFSMPEPGMWRARWYAPVYTP